MNRLTRLLAASALSLLVLPAPVGADQHADGGPGHPSECAPAMDNGRLAALFGRIDENIEGRPGFWKLRVRDREVLVITDERADRMRILVGVADAGQLDKALLYRLMQSNFDTALDARYSVARGVLWSAFIHPLSTLDDTAALSGLGQAVNLAETFGTTYSSGALSFGGGDSNELIRELLEKGQAI